MCYEGERTSSRKRKKGQRALITGDKRDAKRLTITLAQGKGTQFHGTERRGGGRINTKKGGQPTLAFRFSSFKKAKGRGVPGKKFLWRRGSNHECACAPKKKEKSGTWRSTGPEKEEASHKKGPEKRPSLSGQGWHVAPVGKNEASATVKFDCRAREKEWKE